MTRKEELKILIKEILYLYQYLNNSNDFIVGNYEKIKLKQENLNNYVEEYNSI